MTRLLLMAFAQLLFVFASAAQAQVPSLINYQGRVAVGSVNFSGSGQFKFALVNTNGSTTFWSNDGTSTAGSQPTAAVPLTVTKGLYSELLGDTTLTNMTAVPASVFANSDVRLRVWFKDSVNGFQLLTPDQRFAAVGYALTAGSVLSTAQPLTQGAGCRALAAHPAPSWGRRWRRPPAGRQRAAVRHRCRCLPPWPRAPPPHWPPRPTCALLGSSSNCATGCVPQNA